MVGFSNGQQGIISANTEGAPRKLKGFSYRLQGTLKKGGNQKTRNYYLGNTGIEEANFSFSSRYDKETWGMEGFYSQFNTNIGIFSAAHIGNLSDLQRAFNSPEPLEKADFTYDLNRPYQHINHELAKIKTWFTINNSTLWINYSRQYNLRQEYDKHRPLNDSLAALNQPELQFEITTHQTEIILEKFITPQIHLMGGLSGMQQGNTYEGRFFIPNFLAHNAGGFMIAQWKNPYWLVEGGMRYDLRLLNVYLWENNQIVNPQHHYQGFTFTSGIKRFYQKSTFYLNFGSSWRAPNAGELYSNGVHHGAASFEKGDRNLAEEKGYNLQTGYEWQGQDKLSGEILVYNNLINNFIYLLPLSSPILTIRGAFPSFGYKQINANISGADAILNYSIIQPLETRLKLSYLYAIDINTKNKIVNMPCNSIEGKITYQLKDLKWLYENKIGLSILLVDEMRNLPANSDYLIAPEGYYLLGFEWGGNIRMKNQKLIFAVQIQNLLNTEYRNYLNRFRYYADETGMNLSMHLTIPINMKHEKQSSKNKLSN
jgi:iron complex outermembrane receptor protein